MVSLRRALVAAAAALAPLTAAGSDDPVSASCAYNGIALYGEVQVVESFADIDVQIVSSFGDLRVTFVESFPNSCGEWQLVESFPDFTVRFVESFPDIEIEVVGSFPGL